jgi:16S rRNA (cytosine967-C5)-methyltransferase
MTSAPPKPAQTPKVRRVPTARTVAAHVLGRVLFDGAFAAAALDAELARSAQLDARERGMATELVYGVLRTRRALEARLERYAPRGIDDSVTKLHLLVAAYQLLVLERVPKFAAVDAAVSAVRAERGERVGGFANAVLRKLSASEARLSLEAAVKEGTPPWLWQSLVRAVGEDEALAALASRTASASVSVRLVAGRSIPDWLEAASVSPLLPNVRRLERHGDLRRLPGFTEGAFVIQEEGAQVVAHLLGARPGERVLDACAGRGQKTTLLAEQVGPNGTLTAADAYPEKLKALEQEFSRLGLVAPSLHSVDWTLGPGAIGDDFDRVLVDAPCTGTGTLRRRPEIVERLTPADPARLADLQVQILLSAATRVRRGGRVVFAVCSLLDEEAEAVVTRVLSELTPAPFDAPALRELTGEAATSVRLLPRKHGTDGFFVASFLRN